MAPQQRTVALGDPPSVKGPPYVGSSHDRGLWGTSNKHQGKVYKAIAEGSDELIAYKKSRVPLRVQRTALRHEARVLQHLSGHAAIPTLIGYRRVEHFEYLGMELLGADLKGLIERGPALKPGTVAKIGEQLLSAVMHLRARGIVHRDVKPDNVLLHPSDPSRVCIVDFGIALYLGTDMHTQHVQKYDPLRDNRHVVGTLSWCSRNAHAGIELRSQDDVESLAYTLFYLVLGSLPWRDGARKESTKRATERMHDAKRQFSAALPITGIPAAFSTIFQVVEMPSPDLLDGMTAQQQSLRQLYIESGAKDTDALDLTSIAAPTALMELNLIPFQPKSNPAEAQVPSCSHDPGEFTDSYDEWSFGEWDVQSGRDETLTFPLDEVVLLDGQIPDLAHIME